MKIAVICANGKAGRLIVKEALDRGMDAAGARAPSAMRTMPLPWWTRQPPGTASGNGSPQPADRAGQPKTYPSGRKIWRPRLRKSAQPPKFLLFRKTSTGQKGEFLLK